MRNASLPWAFSSGHPGLYRRLQRIDHPQPVVEGSKIHIVDPQRDMRALRILGDSGHRALAMDALLPESMVRGQFYFDGEDLPDRRGRQGGSLSLPGDQQPAAADVLRVHRGPHPECRRSHVAPELDFNSRAFAPVDIPHFFTTKANLALKSN